MHRAIEKVWGRDISVIDPMAGGGSIPLEAARLGFRTLANEYIPVACSILEATVDYPFRFGATLGERARHWGMELRRRFNLRVARFYPDRELTETSKLRIPPHCYIFARTVPCPETGHHTPLVPDWHVLKPTSHSECGRNCLLAVPHVDKAKGKWSVEFVRGDRLRGGPPRPAYDDGKGVSLFSHLQIPAEYIKAKAQAGEMRNAIYAVALKTNDGLKFIPRAERDLEALDAAEKELFSLRPGWEKANIIPREEYPKVSSDGDRARTECRAGRTCSRRVSSWPWECWSKNCKRCALRL